MAKKSKVVEQPSRDDERELMDVVENGVSYVEVRGKRWKVGYKHNRSLTKVSALLVDDVEDEDKVVCKAVAYLRLDTYFKILLFHWLLWRWYYYVKNYREGELIGYIEECKKKVAVADYYGAIMLLTAMKSTKMQMTRAEVERFQAAQLGEQLTASRKSTES